MLKETKSLVESGLFGRIHIGAIWTEGLEEHEKLDGRREVWRIRLLTQRLRGTAGKSLRLVEWYLRLFMLFRGEGLAFVNCHSLSALPLGVLFRLVCGCKIIYDTHELETETQSFRGFRQALARFAERNLITHAEAVIVVSDSIGVWYEKTYGLKNVHVVRNVPYKREFPRKTTLLRDLYGIEPEDFLFLYQGVIASGRGIRLILEAFARLPSDRHVVFLGNGPLSADVQSSAQRYSNIHYHPAVPTNELLEYTAGADVGISLIEYVCLSYYYSLPNKVFEYLMSGVPVIVSDFPEMARLVHDTGCGWTSPVDTSHFIELVNSLTRQEVEMRRDAVTRASESFSWQNEEAKLIDVYQPRVPRDP